MQERSVDSIDRCTAIQKLISVRNLTHQDCDPCWVLEGLYLGATLHPNLLAWLLPSA